MDTAIDAPLKSNANRQINSMNTQESAYARWNEAVQKFDYYVVGIVGAGLVLLLRDFRVEHYGFSQDCFRAGGIFFLLVSFVAGLLRIERFHMFLRFEHARLVRMPYREAVKNGNTNILKEVEYQVMTPDEIQLFEKTLDESQMRLGEGIDSAVRQMGVAYSVRSWSLLIGLLLLFAAAFIPVQRVTQSPKNRTTSQQEPQIASPITPPTTQSPIPTLPDEKNP